MKIEELLTSVMVFLIDLDQDSKEDHFSQIDSQEVVVAMVTSEINKELLSEISKEFHSELIKMMEVK